MTRRPSSLRPGRLVRRSLVWLCLALAGPVMAQETKPPSGPDAAAGAAAQEAPAYVGSAACASCHEDAAAAWATSHHGLAWTDVSPDTVTADFDGTSFTLDGMTARFRIDPDGTHHVTVTEKDGSERDYPIHSVVGVEPLQQYLLETQPGRLQSFDVVWDTEQDRWFHLYPEQDLPPDDGLHWSGPYKNWNGRCAVCHATGFEKNYDPAARSFSSREKEKGVGCEACHGPGAAHLDWAAGRPMPETAMTLDPFGFTQSFDGAKATTLQCGECHSRRRAFTDSSPVAGTPYHDRYGLALLEPGQYFADGQILDEVYVLGSFLQSRMNARGVTCTNCHDPHAARLKAEGNAVCTQCHSPAGNPEFPTLRLAEYDSPAHTFHEQGTDGAACKNCHMPERVYMGNDWRADHSFRVPRPDLSAATGAPDACTGCHTDRDAAWAAGVIAERYPNSTHRGPHFGTVIAAGRENPQAAADDLIALAEDAAIPAIARATALSLLGRASTPEIAARMAPALNDPDPIVRAAAIDVQRGASPQDRTLALIDLLADPSRLVRMEAARALLDAPIAHMPEPIASDLDRAMSEWRDATTANLDFPETHLQLGGMALVRRNAPAAEAAFEEVVRQDPQRVDAWVMLARIAAAVEGRDAAREVLRRAIARNPADPSLQGLAAQVGGL